MEKLTITNPSRKRGFGWNFCTTPSGDGPYGIELPDRPEHVGTILQVREKIWSDRSFRALGGTCYTTDWFYRRRRIARVTANGCEYDRFSDFILDCDGPDGFEIPSEITMFFADATHAGDGHA